jgi:hypothetical protein
VCDNHMITCSENKAFAINLKTKNTTMTVPKFNRKMVKTAAQSVIHMVCDNHMIWKEIENLVDFIGFYNLRVN